MSNSVLSEIILSGRTKNLERAGFNSVVTFYEKESHLALPDIESSGIKVDFAFIDGMHTFDHVLVDFFCVDRILRVGGIVVLDDTNYPSIRKVSSYIKSNRAYTQIAQFPSSGTARCIAFQKNESDTRSFDFHADF